MRLPTSRIQRIQDTEVTGYKGSVWWFESLDTGSVHSDYSWVFFSCEILGGRLKNLQTKYSYINTGISNMEISRAFTHLSCIIHSLWKKFVNDGAHMPGTFVLTEIKEWWGRTTLIQVQWLWSLDMLLTIGDLYSSEMESAHSLMYWLGCPFIPRMNIVWGQVPRAQLQESVY